MSISEFYLNLENKYYKLLDWLDEKGVPIYTLVDPIEQQGIPSMPIVGALILIILLALYFLVLAPALFPTATVGTGSAISPEYTTLSLTVLDFQGSPLQFAEVNITYTDKGAEKKQIKQTNDQGLASFSQVPKNVSISVSVKATGHNDKALSLTTTQKTNLQTVNLQKAGADLTAPPEEIVVSIRNFTNSRLITESIKATFECDGQIVGTFTSVSGQITLSYPKGCNYLLVSSLESQNYSLAGTQRISLITPVLELQPVSDSIKSQFIITVEDIQTKAPIENALVILENSDGIRTDSKNTSTNGKVEFDVEPNHWKAIISSPGYETLKANSVTIPAESPPVSRVYQLQKGGVGFIGIKVVDTNSQPIENISVQLFSNDNETEDSFDTTNKEGLTPTAFTIPNKTDKFYINIVDNDLKYKSKRFQVNLDDLNKTLQVTLEEISEADKTAIEVKVVYADNKAPVRDATVELLRFEPLFNRYILDRVSLTTDINGTLSFKAVEAGKYKLKVYKLADQVELDAVETDAFDFESAILKQVELPVGDGEFQILTMFDNEAVGAASIEVIDSKTHEKLFDLLTDNKGEASFPIKADKSIYFKIIKEGFLPYISQPYPVYRVNQQIIFNLKTDYEQEEVPYLKITGIYLQEQNEYKVADTLEPGREYVLKTLLYNPKDSKVGMHVRLSSDQENISVEDDSVLIRRMFPTSNFNKSKTYLSETYEPTNNEQQDKIKTARNGKHANIEYDSLDEGVYEQNFKILVKDTARSGESFTVNYRTYSVFSETYSRDPVDTELGNNDSVSNLQGLYARTRQQSFSIGPTTKICEDNFCYDFVAENVSDNVKVSAIDDTIDAEIFQDYTVKFNILNDSEKTLNNLNLTIIADNSYSTVSGIQVSSPESLSGELSEPLEFTGQVFGGDQISGSFNVKASGDSALTIYKIQIKDGEELLFEKDLKFNVLPGKEMTLNAQVFLNDDSLALNGLIPKRNLRLSLAVLEESLPISKASVAVYKNGVRINPITAYTTDLGIYNFNFMGDKLDDEVELVVSKPGFRDQTLTMKFDDIFVEYSEDDFLVFTVKVKEPEELVSRQLTLTNTTSEQLELAFNEVEFKDLDGNPIDYLYTVVVEDDEVEISTNEEDRLWDDNPDDELIIFEESIEGLILEPNETKIVKIILVPVDDIAENVNELTRVKASFKADIYSNNQLLVTKNVDLRVKLSLEGDVDNDSCLEMAGTTKCKLVVDASTDNAESTVCSNVFTLKNNCEVDNTPIAVKNLKATLADYDSEIGEITLWVNTNENIAEALGAESENIEEALKSILDEPDSVELDSENLSSTIISNLGAGKELVFWVEFKPEFTTHLKQSKPKILFSAENPKDDEIETVEADNFYELDITATSLRGCLDINPVFFGRDMIQNPALENLQNTYPRTNPLVQPQFQSVTGIGNYFNSEPISISSKCAGIGIDVKLDVSGKSEKALFIPIKDLSVSGIKTTPYDNPLVSNPYLQDYRTRNDAFTQTDIGTIYRDEVGLPTSSQYYPNGYDQWRKDYNPYNISNVAPFSPRVQIKNPYRLIVSEEVYAIDVLAKVKGSESEYVKVGQMPVVIQPMNIRCFRLETPYVQINKQWNRSGVAQLYNDCFALKVDLFNNCFNLRNFQLLDRRVTVRGIEPLGQGITFPNIPGASAAERNQQYYKKSQTYSLPEYNNSTTTNLQNRYRTGTDAGYTFEVTGMDALLQRMNVIPQRASLIIDEKVPFQTLNTRLRITSCGVGVDYAVSLGGILTNGGLANSSNWNVTPWAQFQRDESLNLFIKGTKGQETLEECINLKALDCRENANLRNQIPNNFQVDLLKDRALCQDAFQLSMEPNLIQEYTVGGSKVAVEFPGKTAATQYGRRNQYAFINFTGEPNDSIIKETIALKYFKISPITGMPEAPKTVNLPVNFSTSGSCDYSPEGCEIKTEYLLTENDPRVSPGSSISIKLVEDESCVSLLEGASVSVKTAGFKATVNNDTLLIEAEDGATASQIINIEWIVTHPIEIDLRTEANGQSSYYPIRVIASPGVTLISKESLLATNEYVWDPNKIDEDYCLSHWCDATQFSLSIVKRLQVYNDFVDQAELKNVKFAGYVPFCVKRGSTITSTGSYNCETEIPKIGHSKIRTQQDLQTLLVYTAMLKPDLYDPIFKSDFKKTYESPLTGLDQDALALFDKISLNITKIDTPGLYTVSLNDSVWQVAVAEAKAASATTSSDEIKTFILTDIINLASEKIYDVIYFATKRPQVHKDLNSAHLIFLDQVAIKAKYTKQNDAGKADPDMVAAWKKMQSAAKEDGLDLYIVDSKNLNGYRTLDHQTYLFFRGDKENSIGENFLYVDGSKGSTLDQMEAAYLSRAETSAPPGYSEHHTGLVIDIASTTDSVTKDLDAKTYENTKTDKWLLANAAKFGFKQSYPNDGIDRGAKPEPWQYKYDASLLAATPDPEKTEAPSEETVAPAETSYHTINAIAKECRTKKGEPTADVVSPLFFTFKYRKEGNLWLLSLYGNVNKEALKLTGENVKDIKCRIWQEDGWYGFDTQISDWFSFGDIEKLSGLPPLEATLSRNAATKRNDLVKLYTKALDYNPKDYQYLMECNMPINTPYYKCTTQTTWDVTDFEDTTKEDPYNYDSYKLKRASDGRCADSYEFTVYDLSSRNWFSTKELKSDVIVVMEKRPEGRITERVSRVGAWTADPIYENTLKIVSDIPRAAFDKTEANIGKVPLLTLRVSECESNYYIDFTDKEDPSEEVKREKEKAEKEVEGKEREDILPSPPDHDEEAEKTDEPATNQESPNGIVALGTSPADWKELESLNNPELAYFKYWPVKTSYRQISHDSVGLRSYSRNHSGVDIYAPEGTVVVSPAAGVVSYIDRGQLPSGGGNWIVIKHADGFYSRHLHLVLDNTVEVDGKRVPLKVGTPLKAGQRFATINYGNHLHFEVYDMRRAMFDIEAQKRVVKGVVTQAYKVENRIDPGVPKTNGKESEPVNGLCYFTKDIFSQITFSSDKAKSLFTNKRVSSDATDLRGGPFKWCALYSAALKEGVKVIDNSGTAKYKRYRVGVDGKISLEDLGDVLTYDLDAKGDVVLETVRIRKPVESPEFSSPKVEIERSSISENRKVTNPFAYLSFNGWVKFGTPPKPEAPYGVNISYEGSPFALNLSGDSGARGSGIIDSATSAGVSNVTLSQITTDKVVAAVTKDKVGFNTALATRLGLTSLEKVRTEAQMGVLGKIDVQLCEVSSFDTCNELSIDKASGQDFMVRFVER